MIQAARRRPDPIPTGPLRGPSPFTAWWPAGRPYLAAIRPVLSRLAEGHAHAPLLPSPPRRHWVDYGLLTDGVLFLLVATVAIVGTQTNFFLQRAAEGTGEEATPPPPPASLSWSGPTTGYDIAGGLSPGPFQSVFLTNDGGSNASAAGVSLSGPDAARFSIVLNTCTGALVPSASCEVRIALSASANGSFSASLVVPGAADHPLLGTASGF